MNFFVKVILSILCDWQDTISQDVGNDYSDDDDGDSKGVRDAKISQIFMIFVFKSEMLTPGLYSYGGVKCLRRPVMRYFCNYIRQGECCAPWIHILVHAQNSTQRSKGTLLSPNEAEVRPGRHKHWRDCQKKRLQDKFWSDKMRGGM